MFAVIRRGSSLLSNLAADRRVELRVYRPKLSCVRTFTFKSALIFAALAGALCTNMPASQADQQGDSQWCHVTNKGDSMTWICEHDTIDECQPDIVNGGGFCTINPYWHPNPPQSESAAADMTPAQAAVPIPRPKPTLNSR